MTTNYSNRLIPTGACVLALALWGTALAENNAWYVGGGVGRSNLEPDPSGTQSEVSESASEGFKAFIGRDFSRRLSVEAYYANLGEAEIRPQGTIGYEVYGLSGLYRFYDNREDNGEGLAVFATGGPGVMDNDAEGVTYERQNDVHFHYGVGAEYGFTNGLSARAEVDLYDKDAALMSVSVAKRFGGDDGETYPVAKPAAANVDSDNDGVPDAIDQCEGTPEGELVDAIGCPLPTPAMVKKPAPAPVMTEPKKPAAPLYLARVYFALDSSYLSSAAAKILDKVAVILKQNPNVSVSLDGHTDSIETEKYNMWLSERRAKRVYEYMLGKGVPSARMGTKWFGESRPVASNETAAGRQKNRRTEFVIVKK